MFALIFFFLFTYNIFALNNNHVNFNYDKNIIQAHKYHLDKKVQNEVYDDIMRDEEELEKDIKSMKSMNYNQNLDKKIRTQISPAEYNILKSKDSINNFQRFEKDHEDIQPSSEDDAQQPFNAFPKQYYDIPKQKKQTDYLNYDAPDTQLDNSFPKQYYDISRINPKQKKQNDYQNDDDPDTQPDKSVNKQSDSLDSKYQLDHETQFSQKMLQQALVDEFEDLFDFTDNDHYNLKKNTQVLQYQDKIFMSSKIINLHYKQLHIDIQRLIYNKKPKYLSLQLIVLEQVFDDLKNKVYQQNDFDEFRNMKTKALTELEMSVEQLDTEIFDEFRQMKTGVKLSYKFEYLYKLGIRERIISSDDATENDKDVNTKIEQYLTKLEKDIDDGSQFKIVEKMNEFFPNDKNKKNSPPIDTNKQQSVRFLQIQIDDENEEKKTHIEEITGKIINGMEDELKEQMDQIVSELVKNNLDKIKQAIKAHVEKSCTGAAKDKLMEMLDDKNLDGQKLKDFMEDSFAAAIGVDKSDIMSFSEIVSNTEVYKEAKTKLQDAMGINQISAQIAEKDFLGIFKPPHVPVLMKDVRNQIKASVMPKFCYRNDNLPIQCIHLNMHKWKIDSSALDQEDNQIRETEDKKIYFESDIMGKCRETCFYEDNGKKGKKIEKCGSFAGRILYKWCGIQTLARKFLFNLGKNMVSTAFKIAGQIYLSIKTMLNQPLRKKFTEQADCTNYVKNHLVVFKKECKVSRSWWYKGNYMPDCIYGSQKILKIYCLTKEQFDKQNAAVTPEQQSQETECDYNIFKARGRQGVIGFPINSKTKDEQKKEYIEALVKDAAADEKPAQSTYSYLASFFSSGGSATSSDDTKTAADLNEGCPGGFKQKEFLTQKYCKLEIDSTCKDFGYQQCGLAKYCGETLAVCAEQMLQMAKDVLKGVATFISFMVLPGAQLVLQTLEFIEKTGQIISDLGEILKDNVKELHELASKFIQEKTDIIDDEYFQTQKIVITEDLFQFYRNNGIDNFSWKEIYKETQNQIEYLKEMDQGLVNKDAQEVYELMTGCKNDKCDCTSMMAQLMENKKNQLEAMKENQEQKHIEQETDQPSPIGKLFQHAQEAFGKTKEAYKKVDDAISSQDSAQIKDVAKNTLKDIEEMKQEVLKDLPEAKKKAIQAYNSAQDVLSNGMQSLIGTILPVDVDDTKLTEAEITEKNKKKQDLAKKWLTYDDSTTKSYDSINEAFENSKKLMANIYQGKQGSENAALQTEIIKKSLEFAKQFDPTGVVGIINAFLQQDCPVTLSKKVKLLIDPSLADTFNS